MKENNQLAKFSMNNHNDSERMRVSQREEITCDNGKVVYMVKEGTLVDVKGDLSEILTLPEGIKKISGCSHCFTGVKEIVLPSSLEILGEDCFAFCKKLESVRFNENLKKIEKRAFLKCSSLTCLDLNDGLIFIGESAFANCENLMKIFIPSSVQKIAPHPFLSCVNLQIYCAVESKPKTWHRDWNEFDKPVKWSATR